MMQSGYEKPNPDPSSSSGHSDDVDDFSVKDLKEDLVIYLKDNKDLIT